MEVSTLLVGWGWTYDQLKAGWKEVEDLGYDACYMGDDLFPHHMDDPTAHSDADEFVYDPWTILPVMAETTERMRIGSLVSPCQRRHPGLFAKMTTLVDVISQGRLTVSMGAGNAPDQAKTWDQSYLKGSERAKILEEEVRILMSLWTEHRANFKGEHYSIVNGINSPKPVRQPHPELQLAFKSKKFLTRLAAEFADRVNLLGAEDDDVQDVLDVLRQHCLELGTDYDRIKKGRLATILFTDGDVDEGRLENVIRERARKIEYDPDELVDEHLKWVLSYVGPPQKCAEALKRRMVKLGINEIVICPDTIGKNSYENVMTGLRTFARHVMPQLRQ